MTTIFIGLGLTIAPGSSGGVSAFTFTFNGVPYTFGASSYEYRG